MSYQKRKPYRNKALLKAARDEKCMYCCTQDHTVVAAHSNLGEDGHGMGQKSDDCFVAFLCYNCHSAYDAGKMSQSMFDHCMKRTWRKLLDMGVIG